MTAPTTALPFADFRQVTIRWMDSDGFANHIVHKDEVDAFVKATVQLHHSPGINPYNGNVCAVAAEIFVSSFEATPPVWWSTPGLGTERAQGATVFDPQNGQQVWINPDYAAICAIDERDFGDIPVAA